MEFDSYIDAGVLAAVGLVNGLTPGSAGGRPFAPVDPVAATQRVLAVDPLSLALLNDDDAPGFIRLAHDLRGVFERLDQRDLATAADVLNTLLAKHPANPHLAIENGRWRLHHHPLDTTLVPMWTSICAEGLARMIGADCAHRLGICNAAACDRVFVDTSKNASRRYCSIGCQNRIKTAAFRHRQATLRER
ncbi:MAG TPA: CGNR zinc finger domain-containing protein [Ilumatobacteraceae bacterium]|nr:CGNR zinc finger domain-containing protein [Ilumatobacteraceae bacterium]